MDQRTDGDDGSAKRELVAELLGAGLDDNLTDDDEHATRGKYRQTVTSYQCEGLERKCTA